MTFEELIDKVKTKEKFDFSRFGDGEFHAIFQKQGMNCDAHQYFPEMGLRLKGILESSPKYFIGLQSLAVKQRPEEIHLLTKEHNLNWLEANILHRANIRGRIGELFEALKDRDVLLVGPEHLHPLAVKYNWYHQRVPLKNCWLSYDHIKENISALIRTKNWVILYCAGMSSNILIDDFQGICTQVDLGSVLDPHVGVDSRGYHKKLMAKKEL